MNRMIDMNNIGGTPSLKGNDLVKDWFKVIFGWFMTIMIFCNECGDEWFFLGNFNLRRQSYADSSSVKDAW